MKYVETADKPHLKVEEKTTPVEALTKINLFLAYENNRGYL
jgi:hypothetical protein